MDFDADLAQIQGALLTADNTYTFKNFNCWEDKPTIFKNIVESLYKILSDKGYIVEKKINNQFATRLRKITMFLIFNSDLRTLDELVNNDDIGHVIWVTPTIPKYLLVSCILSLHLGEYYCEAIRYCCPKLSLELSRVATQHMLETTPENSIIIAKKLIASIYSATKRFLNNKEGFHKYVLNGCYESIYELMKYYVEPPNKNQMVGWTMGKWYVHNGEILYNLFDLMIICFNVYLKTVDRNAYENTVLYTHTYGKSSSDSTSSENPEGIEHNINLFLKKYNTLFVDTMKDLVVLVNVDTYCMWSEFPSIIEPTKSLQKAIGELAYKLHSLMTNERNNLKDESASLLVTIMSKPLELMDVIKMADKALILEKANEPSENQKEWLVALFNNECFFEDKASMDCYRNHLDLLSNETKMESFRRCVNAYYKLDKYEHIESIKLLTLECFTKFPVEYQRSALLSVFSKLPLGDLLELPHFDFHCVEVLNKFVEVNQILLSNFFYLFLQNPFKLYLRIFERCVKNSQAIGLLDALHVFEDMHSLKYGTFDSDNSTFSEYSKVKITNELQVVILQALKKVDIEVSENNVESRNFVILTKELINKNILADVIVMFRYLIDQIDSYLSNKDFPKGLIFIKCLREIFVIENSFKYLGLMIIRFAQIMELARWNISSYTLASSEVLEAAIDFEIALISKFRSIFVPRDLEYQWVLNKLGFLTPLNMYYFRDFLPPNKYKTLLADVESYTDLAITLCYLLPRSIANEWKMFFNILNTTEAPVDSFRTLCDTISYIITSAEKINTVKAYCCLENCFKNLVIVLQDCVIPLFDREDTHRLMKEIIYVINILPEAIETRCFNMFLTSISNITDKHLENVEASAKLQERKNIADIFDRFENDSFKEIIKRMLIK